MNHMKNKQKGFVAPLVIIMIAILSIGISVFYYKNKKVDLLIPTGTNTPSDQHTSTTSTNRIEIKPSTPVQNTKTTSKLKITYPNNGENIKIGNKVGITWTNSSISSKGNVTIYLIQNLSGCFNLKSGQACLAVVDPEIILASNISNTNTYSWTPTNKGNYYLRICMGSEKTSSSCDTSDSLITVLDPIEMANKIPVISNVTGPTNLKINENGIWTIVANDPEGQKISYSMSITQTLPIQTNPSKIAGIKSTEPYSSSINWKFDKAGTYLLEFTASDFYGKNATSSIKVNVQ